MVFSKVEIILLPTLSSSAPSFLKSSFSSETLLRLGIAENLLNDGDNRVECLWVRIRGKALKTDIMFGVYYRANQDEEAEKIFY